MIGDERSLSSSPTPAEDRRLEALPGREDETLPYKRRGGGVGSLGKSALLGSDAGGSNLYRWVQGLGGESDLNRPYAQHPYIYACVSAIARAASSVPVRFQQTLANGELERVPNSVLAKVFDFPNPLQSQRKFFRSICTSQMLYGETFIILLKKGPNGQMVPVEAVGGSNGMTAIIEEPEELWPVRGDMVDALIDPITKLPGMWRFSTATGYVDYPAHAIVQIAEVNPYNPLRGMGPMQAAYRTAAKDFVIDRYDEALLQNGGSPGGVLSVDGPLTDNDQRAIREAWHEAHGRPESHRKTAVLPNGTTYKEIGMTPQAMEHEKLRTWDRQTILSMFGVPPVVLGLETMNYATAREQNRIFWETTVLSYLDFITDELQYKLVRRINNADSELKIDFDISGVSALREDVDAKVDRTVKLYSEGHRTFAEAARLAGWEVDEETLEGGDERWIPSSLVQPGVGELQSEVDDDDIPEESEEAEESRSLEYAGVDTLLRNSSEQDAAKTSRSPHLTKDEELDEVYRKWRSTVNMSASELTAWAETECSKKASLSRDPITRNLLLLQTKKADWTKAHIKSANRTINFVSRMSGMPKGEPVSEGCPSKRDISLRNWAYNPDKGKSQKEWPTHLDTEEKRLAFFKSYDEEEQQAIERVTKKSVRIYRDLLLSIRKTVREKTTNYKANPSALVTKQVFTQAEIERFLDVDEEKWGTEMSLALVPVLTGIMLSGASRVADEIGTDIPFVGQNSPSVSQAFSGYGSKMRLGPNETLLTDVKKAVLSALESSDVSSASSLTEAVSIVREQVEKQFSDLLDGLEARAERIARTETVRSFNEGRVSEMRATGITKHTWMSSRDGNVRDSHQFADGQTVSVGSQFLNGLTFPGDPNGAADEVVNCRCITVAEAK